MPTSVHNGPFTFITYEGAKLPKDPNVRKLIHRRAMKHIAATRKENNRGNKDKTASPTVLPLYSDKQKLRGPNTAPNKQRAVGLSTHPSFACLPRPAIPSLAWNIPLPTKSLDYSLLNLATPLTVLHIGISTLSCFGQDVGCIGETLSRMPIGPAQQRLLSFVPSRYGRVPSITHAADCLIARLGQVVKEGGNLSPTSDVAALKSYACALRAIQEAIDDENLRTVPETLCAVELLGLFEVRASSFLHPISLKDMLFIIKNHD